MADIIGRKIVKIRKPHFCFGCGRRFFTGTQMEKSFVTDYKPWTCYLCMTCLKITKTMRYDDEFGYSELRAEALKLEEQNG